MTEPSECMNRANQAESELAQARQQIEELKQELAENEAEDTRQHKLYIEWQDRALAAEREVDHFSKQNLEWANCCENWKKRAESSEQQLAAAQAALLKIAGLQTEKHFCGASTFAAKWTEQPTDALRAFVLGLLPEKRPPAHISSSLVGLDVTLDDWNKVLEQIRANLDAALGGKPRAGRDLEGK